MLIDYIIFKNDIDKPDRRFYALELSPDDDFFTAYERGTKQRYLVLKSEIYLAKIAKEESQTLTSFYRRRFAPEDFTEK